MNRLSNKDLINTRFDRSVSLLCWAYNEEDSIGEYLEKSTRIMDSAVEDYEIVLIDDCSTDKTNEIATSLAEKNRRLKIFRNERNLNVGISSRRAIERASKEFLFWQTIDWSYDISNLRLFLEFLKTFDIVQGVRRKPVQVKMGVLKPIAGLIKLLEIKHLTKRSDNIPKALVSVINYSMIRVLFNIPISDYQNVTFYPTKWIQSIRYEAKSSFTNPEGLIKSYWQGKSIKEVPINFIPRNEGEGKGTRINAISASVSDILRLWCRWVLLGRRDFKKKGHVYRLIPKEWE